MIQPNRLPTWALVAAIWLVLLTLLLVWFAAIGPWHDHPELHTTILVVAGIVAILCIAIAGFVARHEIGRSIARARRHGRRGRKALIALVQQSFESRVSRSVMGIVSLAVLLVGFSEVTNEVRAHGISNVASGWGLASLVALLLLAACIALPRQGTVSMAIQPRRELTFNHEDQIADPIDLRAVGSVRFRIKPGPGVNAWKLGLKFSADGTFYGGRYGARFPLWQMFKNASQDALFATYYNEQGRGTGNATIRNTYHDDEVSMVCEITRDLRIRVDGDPGYSQTFGLKTHRYIQLSAWADGVPFELKVWVDVAEKE